MNDANLPFAFEQDNADLRWHACHSAEVSENINLHGLQSGPRLLLVSGLGFALGQSLALPNFKKGFSSSLIYS